MTTPRSLAREAVALEAQIRDAETAIAALLTHLRPGCPPQQRTSLERMIAKKQTTLRRLRNKHLGLVRGTSEEHLAEARERQAGGGDPIPGQRTLET